MINYADMVIVTGMSSDKCISTLLYLSDIGRCTSILYINNPKPEEKEAEGGESGGEPEGTEERKILVALFEWEHQFQRPNTHTYPISCPKCHTLLSWIPPTSMERNDGDAFILLCNTKVKVKGKKITCDGTFTINGRPPTTEVEAPYVGRWYSRNSVEVVADVPV